MAQIIMIGYTETGREVRFQFETDANQGTAMDQIRLVDKTMLDAGVLPARPVPGEGEQKQMIRYILRRKQKNDDGTFTPVLDLYSDKFRWVACYINDQQRAADFARATGLDLNRMPISASMVKEIDTSDPDLMSMFAVLNPPVEIIWKPNPRWNPDLNDEEKKKTPKRYFVRWASVSTASNGANGSSTSTQTRQTDNRQTGRSSSTVSTSTQTSSRQTAQTTPPRQTSPEQGRRMAMDNGTTRTEITTSITAAVAQNGSHYYVTPDKAYTFTRDLFRAAGYDCDHWKPDNTYALNPAATIISQKQESGHWKIVDAQRMGAAEEELFGGGLPGEFESEPPPEFDPDEKF